MPDVIDAYLDIDAPAVQGVGKEGDESDNNSTSGGSGSAAGDSSSSGSTDGSGVGTVHPGSFCSPPGATGVAKAGTLMICGPGPKAATAGAPPDPYTQPTLSLRPSAKFTLRAQQGQQLPHCTTHRRPETRCLHTRKTTVRSRPQS